MKNPRITRAQRGFTLVEIMIVVAILGIILAIALTTWVKQRELSQARTCQENLSKVQGAKEQWALENNQSDSATPVWSDLVAVDGTGYIKKQPFCPADGTYTIGSMAEQATCSVTAPTNHNTP